MIKVIYILPVTCKRVTYILKKEGTLLSIPRKNEFVRINENITLDVRYVIYIDGGNYVEVTFIILEDRYLEIKKAGFKEIRVVK